MHCRDTLEARAAVAATGIERIVIEKIEIIAGFSGPLKSSNFSGFFWDDKRAAAHTVGCMRTVR